MTRRRIALPSLVLAALGFSGTMERSSTASAEDPPPKSPKTVSAREQRRIDAAIEKAVRWLRRQSTPDGSFGSGLYSQGELGVGLTSLAGLALRNGGVARDDPAIAHARAFVHRGVVQALPTDGSHVARIGVYSAGLAIAFLLEAGEKPDDAAVVQLVTFLADSYDSEGWWPYSVWNPSALAAPPKGVARWERPLRTGNVSTTVYAMLGLHAAWRHGVPFVRKGPERFVDTFGSIQWPDGGFSYMDAPPGGSVRATTTYYGGTASALASYLMAGEITGAWKRPDDALRDPHAAKSLDRIGRGFGKPSWGDEPTQAQAWRGGTGLANGGVLDGSGVGPGFREETFNLYATERVGMLLGSDRIGRCAWYADGAARLIDGQEPDGSWTPRWSQDFPRTVTTSLGLLFLARAGRPIGEVTPSGGTAVLTGGADEQGWFDGAVALPRIEWFDRYHRAMRRLETLGGAKRADWSRRMAQLGPRVVFALADDLEAEPKETRAAAGEVLVALTGEDFGFVAAAGAKERAKTVAAWRQWVERHGTTLVLVNGALLPRAEPPDEN